MSIMQDRLDRRQLYAMRKGHGVGGNARFRNL
jgi:hypothetical protein